MASKLNIKCKSFYEKFAHSHIGHLGVLMTSKCICLKQSFKSMYLPGSEIASLVEKQKQAVWHCKHYNRLLSEEETRF